MGQCDFQHGFHRSGGLMSPSQMRTLFGGMRWCSITSIHEDAAFNMGATSLKHGQLFWVDWIQHAELPSYK